MTILDERLSLLETLHLHVGGHKNWQDGACVMEAVGYVAGEQWSDHPKCASPTLGAFLRSLNDRLSDEKRQLLKPYIVRLVGTNTGPEDEETRRWMICDWLVHEYAPALFRALDLTEQAESFERLAAVTGAAEWEAARKTIYEIRDEAWKKRRAAAAAADVAAVAAAVAVADADAAAVAAAAGDAAAAAVAAAAAAAAADAAAAAAADVAAVAAADAAADVYKRAVEAAAKETDRWDRRNAAYEVFKPYYRDRYDGLFEKAGLEKSVFGLIDRLIDVNKKAADPIGEDASPAGRAA